VFAAALRRLGPVALLLGPGLSDAAAGTQSWQPNAEITAAAESYLRERTGRSANRTTVKAGSLDPRHRLALCDQPLDAFLRRGTEISARTIVGVRCEGTKQWTVYVPVNVFVTARVYTARQTLPRNHLLTEADIRVDERDVSRSAAGYMSNKDQLIGQRLKQQVIAGRIITPAMLQADFIVRRGQLVTLIAAGGGINIKMAGKALKDGALGQRIQVENSGSGRVVEGIVRSQELVEVLLPSANRIFHANPKVSSQSADTQVSNNDR
jgi:flagella basal body P-ring formation protein FlgA